eukprot:gene11180-11330_t
MLYQAGEVSNALLGLEDQEVAMRGYPEVHAALAAVLYAERPAQRLRAEQQFDIALEFDSRYQDASWDIFECAVQGVALGGASTGCDSSDCLLCQGQRTFCSKEVTDGVSGWLGKRLSSVHEPGAHAAALQRAPSDDSSAIEQPQQQKRKRFKKGTPDVPDEGMQEISVQHAADAALDSSTTQLLVSDHTGSPASFGCWTGSGRTWQWREEFAGRRLPAPCKMIDIATLQQPSACAGDPTTQYRKDMISGLEFSTDGQLLAAAGVSKQAQVSWTYAGKHRLPGKVSSIAWSPDMEGVLSVGDYDGTLTQVHVASGHYLNEVDAHGGRRIWSVCHSKLRPHVAATASDDCTAKLWAGRGLAAAVATIRLPGTPAVCGVDFCDWNENLLGLAAADHRVHLYDLRRLATPLLTLSGHRRAVSYAKFFGPGQLPTGAQPRKLFKGHKNEKNFVGLAVLPSAGLMAVGSESRSTLRLELLKSGLADTLGPFLYVDAFEFCEGSG